MTLEKETRLPRTKSYCFPASKEKQTSSRDYYSFIVILRISIGISCWSVVGRLCLSLIIILWEDGVILLSTMEEQMTISSMVCFIVSIIFIVSHELPWKGFSLLSLLSSLSSWTVHCVSFVLFFFPFLSFFRKKKTFWKGMVISVVTQERQSQENWFQSSWLILSAVHFLKRNYRVSIKRKTAKRWWWSSSSSSSSQFSSLRFSYDHVMITSSSLSGNITFSFLSQQLTTTWTHCQSLNVQCTECNAVCYLIISLFLVSKELWFLSLIF